MLRKRNPLPEAMEKNNSQQKSRILRLFFMSKHFVIDNQRHFPNIQLYCNHTNNNNNKPKTKEVNHERNT